MKTRSKNSKKQDIQDTTTATSTSTAAIIPPSDDHPRSRSRTRKPRQNQNQDEQTHQRTTRTSRSSTISSSAVSPHPHPPPTASTSNDTPQNQQPQQQDQPSSKALGKRRAISPDPTPAPARSASTSSSKRRKLSSYPTHNLLSSASPSISANSPLSISDTPQTLEYNLRSRRRPSNVASSPVQVPSATTPSSSARMPRKGARASRSSTSKANSNPKAPSPSSASHEEKKSNTNDKQDSNGDVEMLDQPVASGPSSSRLGNEDEDVGMHDDDDGARAHPPNSDEDNDSDGSEPDQETEEEDEDEDQEQDHDDGQEEDEQIHGDDLDDEDDSIGEGDPTGDGDFLDNPSIQAFRSLHGIMSGMSSRLKGLLAALKNKESDASAKLIALQDLTELLSVSTEDTLAGYFQVEAFVKELVTILKGDPNVGMGGVGGSGMTCEEMIAFGLDPEEMGGGSGGGVDEESNVQMMLLACRCLANLMEALPGTAHSVVYAGAVPVLCSKLLEIQYIDLAEQTLSTLEKLSEEVPSSIVREGGLAAILNFIDFFSFHVQRTAVTAAANCCRSLSLDSFSKVVDVMPTFKNILGYPDQRVVEQASLGIVRIVESYRHYPDKLEELLTEDILVAIRSLINPDSSTLGTGTYTQVLKVLSIAARASPQVAITQIELNIGQTLYHLLTGVAAPDFPDGEEDPQALPRKAPEDDLLVVQNLVQRPKDQIQETLNLACELLPPLPKDGLFDPRLYTHKADRYPKVKREDRTPDLGLGPAAPTEVAASTSATAAVDEELGAAVVKMEVVDEPLGALSSASPSRSSKSRDPAKDAALEKRLDMYETDSVARKRVVNRFYALLLPTLVDVYAASVNPQVRTKAILGLLKIVNFCDPKHLADILKGVSMASFLSGILSSHDHGPITVNALQLVELLLIKMKESYQYHFRREGVVHEIERIGSASIITPHHRSSKRTSPSRTPRADGTTSGSNTPITGTSSGIARSLQQHAGLLDTSGPKVVALSTAETIAQDAITLRARHLRDEYAAPDSEPAIKAKLALENIKKLGEKLDAAIRGRGKAGRAKAKALVEEVAALFADLRTPLSSFELLESGLVDGLLRFSTDHGLETFPPSARQEMIAQAFKPQLVGGSPTPAFSVLVKRLQDSLSRMEQFEVVMAASGSGEVESKRDGPAMLARQLKLRLVAEEGSDVPRSCTNIVVSIHAIATFQAFNDYLRPRILAATTLSDRTSTSAPSGSLSSFLASFAAAAAGTSPPDSAEVTGGSTSRLSQSLGGPSTSAPPPVEPTDARKPARRRSTRLSGKSNVSTGEASTSKSTLDMDDAPPSPVEPEVEKGEDEDMCGGDDGENPELGDEELFPADFDPTPPSRDERTVTVEMAEGDKIVAKTPDGTRVGTPALGKAAPTSTKPSPSKPRGSYAAAVKAEPTDFHLEFSLNGHPVDLDTTVFGAIYTHEATSTESRRHLWHSVYTVKFKKIAGPAKTESERESPVPISRDAALLKSLPASIPANSQQAKILQLLWALHTINSDYETFLPDVLSENLFVNNKLTAKLNRQLEEPMIVASACLPAWASDLPQSFPFLFPFDTRFTFLQSTSFGYARLMQKWIGQARTDHSRRDDNLGFLARLQRQKVRISRDRILESAFKVFELYGASRASLEVEFFQEVGSGLGPTLEFYALVSKEFAKKDLDMWRTGDGASSEGKYVHNPAGLFPKPWDDLTTEAGKNLLKVFRVLGQFVGKALMDSRIIDVHFSRSFMKLVLDLELPLTVASVKAVDPAMGKSLEHLQEYVDAKQAIEADESKSDAESISEIQAIRVRDASVDDLSLDFTLPGTDIELKYGGKDIAVSIDNLEEYIDLVIDWILRRGIAMQVKEFKIGFSTVFPVRDLQSFTPAELVMMTSAIEEDWSVECLTSSTKADHGFTMDSRPVRDVISIMSELTPTERRDFLSFITGSPRLPIGGFAALSPTLTIVRKDGGDGSLPSVMTCVNYIKLPNYSSREVVKDRIMTAVKEGAGGFHLS